MSNVRKCVGKESFQRMNYLLQLSNHLAAEDPAAHVAAQLYSNLAINISKKSVQRLDCDVKRTLCKKCRSFLIPGITCKVRIKRKKVIKHCMKCSQIKVFNIQNAEYLPWSQQKESLVEVLDYTSNEKELGHPKK